MNTQTPVQTRYRSTTVLSNLIMILSGVLIVGGIIVLLTYFNFIARLGSYQNNPPMNIVEDSMARTAVYKAAFTFDKTNAFFNAVNLPLVLVIQVIFFIWVYGSSRNLLALGVQGMSHTPGWAVGWFFIPAANLIMPPLVLSEIWKASNPNPGDTGWLQSRGTPWIAMWWLCLLGMVIASFLLPVLLANAPNPSAAGDFSALTIQLLVIVLLRIGWALGLLLSVAGITSRQSFKHTLHLAEVSVPRQDLAGNEPAITPASPGHPEKAGSPAEPRVLNQAEIMVLTLLAGMLPDDTIARKLNLPESHILQLKTSLYNKFGVNRDDELVWEARQKGYLQ